MSEIGGIVIFGILAQWTAWRLKIPAILPLILIGLIVGPVSTFFTQDGTKWIEPVWNGEEGLFPDKGLYNFVSLSIGIILFEGSLTLKKSEILNVGGSILRLITLGTVITFFLGGLATHFAFHLSWPISFLFASLIIVTGPTVIAPILRNIPLKKDVTTILKWESILIDPIGALAAVLVFEYIRVDFTGVDTINILWEFVKIVLSGLLTGFVAAWVLYFLVKKNWIPQYLKNVVSLSAVMAVFVFSNYVASDSGLLSVVMMGLILANINLPNIQELLHFKESLSILLISILFILLAANINVEDMLLVYNWKALLLFFVVILILRPLSVFVSTAWSGLRTNEKLFISWVGPRGIVAAGIASLFGLELQSLGVADAQYITPLVFLIVLGTVLLNATTARPVAKLLGVYLDVSGGIMIIGANKISRLIASYLKKNNRHVVLIDSNKVNVEKAKKLGLYAFEANIYEDDLSQDIELSDIGFLMALTGSTEVNEFSLQRFKKEFGENGAFRLITSEEIDRPEKIIPQSLFSDTADYRKLMDVASVFPIVNEIKLQSARHFNQLKRNLETSETAVPLFIKDFNGTLHILSSKENIPVEKGYKLVYIGKSIDALSETEINLQETVSHSASTLP
ncbi:MAG: cell shape-determining protein [Flavobacteriales bacterium CG_4_9_14_3_um_filter_40_17]|nr:MAG: cell shape-determining protein [Flavobacteriales bacterium CG_4_9_14_3_um_filter_40_17]